LRGWTVVLFPRKGAHLLEARYSSSHRHCRFSAGDQTDDHISAWPLPVVSFRGNPGNFRRRGVWSLQVITRGHSRVLGHRARRVGAGTDICRAWDRCCRGDTTGAQKAGAGVGDSRRCRPAQGQAAGPPRTVRSRFRANDLTKAVSGREKWRRIAALSTGTRAHPTVIVASLS